MALAGIGRFNGEERRTMGEGMLHFFCKGFYHGGVL